MRFRTAAILLISTVGWVHADSGPLSAESYQPELAKLVSSFLTYYHYSKEMVDDKVAERAFDNYLESLDYNHMYLLASDVKDFQTFVPSMDDDLRGKTVKIDKPFLMFNRFRNRVYERIPAILDMIDKGFDFTLDEYLTIDRSKEPWADTVDDLNERWRLAVKEQSLRFRMNGKSDEDTRKLMKVRYERLLKDYQDFDSVDVLEQYLSAIAHAFDPHSTYLKPATKDNFDIDMGHSLEGIGATLRRENEYTIVVDLIPGGPAAMSGEVKPNDKIFAVAQGDEEPVDVVDMRIDRVVKYIRGTKGTEVRLHLIPADAMGDETKLVSLIRDKVMITAEDVSKEIREVEDKDGNKHRYGVITVPSFYLDSQAKMKEDPNYKSTTRDVRKLIKELEQESVDGLVIDLRNNGGGSLDEAVELTGLFIKDGPVVQVRGRKGQYRVLDDPDHDIVYEGPLVVLTNVFSASASEIFAGAIQDYDRGLVVGDSATHGKGTVQNVIGLDSSLERVLNRQFEDGVAGALKLTTHKFYRVSGSSTQLKGVEPDLILPSPSDVYELGEQYLDNALEWDVIDRVNYTNYGLANSFVEVIKENSKKRVDQNREFQYLREDNEAWRKRKLENRVSLNEAVRAKEKADLESLDKIRKQARLAAMSKTPQDVEGGLDEVTITDFVLDEAVNILYDYDRATRGKFVASNNLKKAG